MGLQLLYDLISTKGIVQTKPNFPRNSDQLRSPVRKEIQSRVVKV